MRYGVILTVGDLRTQGDLAGEAGTAGWDGAFTWDGVAVDDPHAWEPWVAMAVLASRTERVTLGVVVTPPTRCRPWKLAHEALSVDHLSGVRLVLPNGIGRLSDDAFAKVDGSTDRAIRAGRLDDTTALLDGF